MTTTEIIEAIKVLTDVVKANRGWGGCESTMDAANEKIKELTAKLNV